MNATRRKRFRSVRGPKPRTIVPCQHLEFEITGFAESFTQDAKYAHVLEKSWGITCRVFVTGYEITRNSPDQVRDLIRCKVDSATMAVVDKADWMLRHVWGSILPRRKVA